MSGCILCLRLGECGVRVEWWSGGVAEGTRHARVFAPGRVLVFDQMIFFGFRLIRRCWSIDRLAAGRPGFLCGRRFGLPAPSDHTAWPLDVLGLAMPRRSASVPTIPAERQLGRFATGPDERQPPLRSRRLGLAAGLATVWLAPRVGLAELQAAERCGSKCRRCRCSSHQEGPSPWRSSGRGRSRT